MKKNLPHGFLLVLLSAASLWLTACRQAQTEQTPSEDFHKLVQTYEPKDRDVWQKPELIFDLLGNMSGKTIADVGTGTGYFSIRLAPQAAKVLALDIDRRFLNYVDSVKTTKLTPEQAARLEVRLVKEDDPGLAPNEVDDVLIVNTFGYIKEKKAYLRKLKKGMKPGGRILIVDYRPDAASTGFAKYLVSFEQVEKLLKEAGFRRLLTDNYNLDYQYIVMAQKPPEQ